MMECERARGFLPLLLLGEAGTREEKEARAHLLRCDGCGGEEKRLAVILGTLGRDEGVPDPGEAYWESFLPRLRNRMARRAFFPGLAGPARALASLAASLLLLVASAALVGRWSPPLAAEPAMRLNRLVERAEPAAVDRALGEVFPTEVPAAAGDGQFDLLPTAEEMQDALDEICPDEDSETLAGLNHLPPEARRRLIKVLDPGRG